MKIWLGGSEAFAQTDELRAALVAKGVELVGSDADVMHWTGWDADLEALPEVRASSRIVQFWGSEVRVNEASGMRNPYARLIGRYQEEDRIAARLREMSAQSPACIVPDFESLAYVRPYFKRIYVLPYAQKRALRGVAAPPPDRDTPTVAHAPLSTHEDGTAYVREVLERLAQHGYRFHAVVKQGLSAEERADLFRQADIVVDRILNGAYGIAAVDAMTLGRPVAAFVHPDHREQYGAHPVQSANPATLYRVLAELIRDPAKRVQLGRQGQTYANQVHSARRLAGRLRWIYERELRMQLRQMPEEVGVVYNLYRLSEEDMIDIEPEPAAPIELTAGMRRLYPNRMVKRKNGVYFSFNLAEIPQGLQVQQAVLHATVRRPGAPVPIFRITRPWDRMSVKRRKRWPRIARKSMYTAPAQRGKRRKRAASAPVAWNCTAFARHWQANQLDNHGVFVRQPLASTPFLDVTVSRG